MYILNIHNQLEPINIIYVIFVIKQIINSYIVIKYCVCMYMSMASNMYACL